MILRKNNLLKAALIYSFVYAIGPPIFMGGYISWTGLIWIFVQILIVAIYFWAIVKGIRSNNLDLNKIILEFGIVIIGSLAVLYAGGLMLRFVY